MMVATGRCSERIVVSIMLWDLRVNRENLKLLYVRRFVPKGGRIRRFISSPFLLAKAVVLWTILASSFAKAQTGYTWQQVKDKFEAANPALKADAFGVDELRAEEITAYLRPNPQFNFATDGTQFPPHKGP